MTKEILDAIRARMIAAKEAAYQQACHNLNVERELAGLLPLEELLQTIGLSKFNFDDRLTAEWQHALNFGFQMVGAHEIERMEAKYTTYMSDWLKSVEGYEYEAVGSPMDKTTWFVTKRVLMHLKLAYGGSV